MSGAPQSRSGSIEVLPRSWRGQRLYRQVTTAYPVLMASRWGYNLFGRALPSTFFLLGFVYGTGSLREALPSLSEASPAGLLGFATDVAWRIVALSQVLFFAIRKRPISRPSSLLGAVVALFASFFGSFGIFFNTLGLRAPPPANPDPLLAALAGITSTLGMALLAASFVSLGRHVGVFPEVRGLVQKGPYRVLRHPIYTGYLLGAAGGLPVQGSFGALIVFGLYYVLVAWRAALEERAFERTLGDEYRAFRRSTWGVGPPHLVPG